MPSISYRRFGTIRLELIVPNLYQCKRRRGTPPLTTKPKTYYYELEK
jgi:hypothetical protein